MPTVNCPHCGRAIPFELHELDMVIECARCDGRFTPGGGPVVATPPPEPEHSCDESVEATTDLTAPVRRNSLPWVALGVGTLAAAVVVTLILVSRQAPGTRAAAGPGKAGKVGSTADPPAAVTP